MTDEQFEKLNELAKIDTGLAADILYKKHWKEFKNNDANAVAVWKTIDKMHEAGSCRDILANCAGSTLCWYLDNMTAFRPSVTMKELKELEEEIASH